DGACGVYAADGPGATPDARPDRVERLRRDGHFVDGDQDGSEQRARPKAQRADEGPNCTEREGEDRQDHSVEPKLADDHREPILGGASEESSMARDRADGCARLPGSGRDVRAEVGSAFRSPMTPEAEDRANGARRPRERERAP